MKNTEFIGRKIKDAGQVIWEGRRQIAFTGALVLSLFGVIRSFPGNVEQPNSVPLAPGSKTMLAVAICDSVDNPAAGKYHVSQKIGYPAGDVTIGCRGKHDQVVRVTFNALGKEMVGVREISFAARGMAPDYVSGFCGINGGSLLPTAKVTDDGATVVLIHDACDVFAAGFSHITPGGPLKFRIDASGRPGANGGSEKGLN